MSAYCLTDAFASNRGEPAERAGTPTFSADLTNLPIIKHQTVGLDRAAAFGCSNAEPRREGERAAGDTARSGSRYTITRDRTCRRA
jgi:hypothetical protein